MRLSNVKGERTFDVIADLIDPIYNIAMDPEAAVMFKREKLPEGMTTKEFMAGKIRKSLPTLLKTHKEDLVTILAAIEGVTPKQYEKKLNMGVLVRDVIDLLSDDGFSDLFTSAQTETSSGSAQGNLPAGA